MALSSLLRRASASVIPLAICRPAGPKPSVLATVFAAFKVRDVNGYREGFNYNFSTSAAVSSSEDLDADDNLRRIIKSEIECAKANIDDSLEIPAGFPFIIDDNPGEKTVLLKRKYQSEVIKVLADTPDRGADNEDVEDSCNIPLIVSITKENGLCLEFGITAYPDEISIDYMSTKNPNVHEDQLPFEGPDFTDLDENLQKAFHKYLDIRGINFGVGNFLIKYMEAKDAKEYLRWLKSLQNFHKTSELPQLAQI